MEVKTVKEVSNLTGLSETTIYKHIRKENLSIRVLNGIKMITEESLKPFIEKYAPESLNHSKGVQNHNENTNSSNSEIHIGSKGVQNPLIDKLYSEITELKQNVGSLQSEKDSLFERLVSVEREQKKEIQQIHNSKDEQLKMYMELLKKQSDNILEARPQQHTNIDDAHDVEVIDTETTKKRMKPNKFFKIMYSKGYSDKEIKKIIKKRLNKNDSRFGIINGKTIIYKDKFKDL